MSIMKKKYLFILVIALIALISIYYFADKIGIDDNLAVIHYTDFKVVSKNKELNEDSILKGSEEIYGVIKSHLNEESQEQFFDKLKMNLKESIKNEWIKIDEFSIDAFYVSDSIDIKYITQNVGDYEELYGAESKFVIVKACSNGDIKYIYMYPYIKDPNDDIYKLNISSMMFAKELSDIIFTKLKIEELDNIKWHKIDVK